MTRRMDRLTGRISDIDDDDIEDLEVMMMRGQW